MSKVIFLIFAALISLNAYSANVVVSNKEISAINTLATGNFVVYLSESADPICHGGGKVFHAYANQNGVTSEGIKSLYSTATTALVAGKLVTIQYDNSNSSCFIHTILIYK